MVESSASYIGEPPAWQSWSSIDLILDGIFGFLDPPDLKNARLVSRKWAICGSRPLVRKTFIRLSQVVPAAQNFEKLLLPHYRNHFVDGKFKDQNEFRQGQTLDGKDQLQLSDSDTGLWETLHDLGPFEYLSFPAYSNYMDSAVFSSEFEPRNFVVYNFSDVVDLKSLEFSAVERLTVVFVKPSEAYALMSRVHRVFPTLKSLELGYIASDNDNKYTRQWIVNLVLKLEAIRTELPSIEKRKRLEELSFPFPANLENSDWSFLARFANLKKLHIRWPGEVSIRRPTRVRGNLKGIHGSSYRDSASFGDWFHATSGYLRLCNLTDLNLRFQLTPLNGQQVTAVVAASTNLKNLTLQVYGHLLDAIYELLYELDIKTLCVLNALYCSLETGDQGMEPIAAIGSMLKHLSDKDFFRNKPTWTLVFRDAGGAYHINVEKYETQCIIQTKGTEKHLEDFTPAFLKQVPCVFQNYNYVYQFGPEDNDPAIRYRNENINWQPPAASATTSDSNSCLSETFPHRGKPQRFLCEFPGFLNEAGLFLGKHSKDKEFRTLAYCFVSMPVIAKWSRYLQTELLIHEYQRLQFQEIVHSHALQSISVRKQELLQLLRAGNGKDWCKDSFNLSENGCEDYLTCNYD